MNLKTRQLEALRSLPKQKEAMALADDFHLDQFYAEPLAPSRLKRRVITVFMWTNAVSGISQLWLMDSFFHRDMVLWALVSLASALLGWCACVKCMRIRNSWQ